MQSHGYERFIGRLGYPIEEVVLDHDNKLEYLLTMMQDQQKTLAALVKHLEQPNSSPDFQNPSPWNLKDGTERQRRKILGPLNDWISWYNDTYPGVAEHMIPLCWFHYRVVVQELVTDRRTRQSCIPSKADNFPVREYRNSPRNKTDNLDGVPKRRAAFTDRLLACAICRVGNTVSFASGRSAPGSSHFGRKDIALLG